LTVLIWLNVDHALVLFVRNSIIV